MNCLSVSFFFLKNSVVGRKTAGASGIETGNPIEHRLHQHPKKGLVAALQTVYEPPAEVAATLEGKKPVRTQRLAATSLLGFEPGMLARPWQAGSTALHGSETAPSPPPPISKSPQLGAVAAGAAGIVHASPDGLSSSQSRSVSGRSPGRFPDLAANTRPPHVTASGDKSRNGSHGAEPSHHLNRYQSSSKPRRRLSEPNRDSAVTSSTANAVAMVDETRSKHSSSKDAVDNRVKLSSKTLSSLKGIMGSRENYEDEELQYGPGIVNKLKSRYLSRTLRERAVESHRPSLRRAASLEDWLDKDSVPTGQQSRASKSTTAGDDGSSQVTVRGRSKGERPVSLNLAPQVEQQVPAKSPVVPVVVSKARDLKKTRSIDCVGQPAWRSASVTDLLVTSPTPQQQQQQQQQTPKSSTPTRSPTQPTTPTSPKTPVHLLLSKDAIVIVDKNASPEAKTAANKSSVSATSSSSTAVSSSSSVPSRGRRSLPNSRYNVEDPELPPPDTVRQVKRLFETSGSNRKVAVNNRRSQSAGPGFNRTPLSAANQTTDKSSLNVIRMNQTNLDNSKGVSSPSVVAANKKVTDAYKLVSDSKPVVITKPSPIRPKPAVLSPKPVVVTVGDKTRVISGPAPFKTPAAVVVTDLPVDKSEDEKDNDDDNGIGSERGFKIISKTALDNIHKESTTVKFNFDDSNKKEEKPVTDKSATSVQSRQVGVIRPQIKSPTILSDKPVIFDNPPSPNTNNAARTVDVSVKKDEPVMKPLPPPPSLTNNKTTIDTRAIDVQKVTKENSSTLSAPAVETGVRPTSPAVVVPTATVSKPPPIVVVDKKEIKVIVSSSVHEKTANPTVVIAAASSPSSAAAAAAVREPKAKQWHQNQSETTTVFNFVNDNKNVDHIRNEGGSTGKLVYQVIHNFRVWVFDRKKTKKFIFFFLFHRRMIPASQNCRITIRANRPTSLTIWTFSNGHRLHATSTLKEPTLWSANL